MLLERFCYEYGGSEMDKKMVFFDLDGTLLDDDKKIRSDVRSAVRKLKENGVLVGLATGRAPFLFEFVRKELEIDNFIALNGQYVVHEGKAIYKNPMEPEQLYKLVQLAETNNHPLVFLNHLEMRANEKNNKDIETGFSELHAEYPPVDPNFYQGREIYQTLLFCKEEDERIYINKVNDFQYIRWHDLSLDVLPSVGSKALAIERVIQHVGVKRENTYAFGDGLNDIEMLKYVGKGVAMGNALEEAKKAADFVTDNT